MKVAVKEVGCESVRRMYLIQNISFHLRRVVCRAGSQDCQLLRKKGSSGDEFGEFRPHFRFVLSGSQ